MWQRIVLLSPTVTILMDLSTAVATLDTIILFPTLGAVTLMSVATIPPSVDLILSVPILLEVTLVHVNLALKTLKILQELYLLCACLCLNPMCSQVIQVFT